MQTATVPTEGQRPGDPINNIEWRHVDQLSANNWNPNAVLSTELKLLEGNILRAGWIQPLLITEDGTIIDGFHRWMLSRESKALRERYEGQVPCAVLRGVSSLEAKVLTVNMNRAKGTHVAFRLAELVQDLVDGERCDLQELQVLLGATKEEVDLLYQNSIFKAKKLDSYRYSNAWVPHETEATAPSTSKTKTRRRGQTR